MEVLEILSEIPVVEGELKVIDSEILSGAGLLEKRQIN